MPITAKDAAMIAELQTVVRESEHMLEESRQSLKYDAKILHKSYATIVSAKVGRHD